MSYIVFEIQDQGEGAVSTVTNVYTDQAQAENKYHTVLAAAASSSVKNHSCVMLQSDGKFIKSETYEH